jgi:hypothetical protein
VHVFKQFKVEQIKKKLGLSIRNLDLLKFSCFHGSKDISFYDFISV